MQKELPVKYMDHSLVNSRNYKNMRELHIEPDRFLVYQIESEELILKLIRKRQINTVYKNISSLG